MTDAIPYSDWSSLVDRWGFPPEPPQVWDYVGRPHSFTEGDMRVLLCLLENVQPQSVMEIGIFEGNTAGCVLQHIPSIQRYVGVDRPRGSGDDYSVFDNPAISGVSIGHYARRDGRFTMLLPTGGTGALTADISPRNMDVCIIDGDHRYLGVSRDTAIAIQSLRSGGLLVWHDYDEEHGDVMRFLNERAAAGHDITLAGSLCWEIAP